MSRFTFAHEFAVKSDPVDIAVHYHACHTRHLVVVEEEEEEEEEGL